MKLKKYLHVQRYPEGSQIANSNYYVRKLLLSGTDYFEQTGRSFRHKNVYK